MITEVEADSTRSDLPIKDPGVFECPIGRGEGFLVPAVKGGEDAAVLRYRTGGKELDG
jgi:hypothetical protein